MKIIIALPAYNEEQIIDPTVDTLVNFCRQHFSGRHQWQVVIADNYSTDQTGQRGRALARRYPEVDYLLIRQQGKGIAIKTAWQNYDADIYCFMDADLATSITALPALINGVATEADVVIGSRFHRQSHVERSLVRWVVSWGYRLILRLVLKTKVSDAPCGFKAINRAVRDAIVPVIQDQAWFFDSELVLLAEKKGFKIKAIPIAWRDPREGSDRSRVQVVSLALAYLRKVFALKKRLAR
jgi:glycosyltransferase involved in cell wall biosynthesis